ncbi:Bug family tripartite tricarboxylate transporter substrate binding protein [Falsiroseomonas oryzae]|uniref:Bug family tripartite tricarboxylate transporter substrate binding protein n=1 Tax=Falsiroseomonas oryzae TaxID=2766473 RepID=UPI0022EAB9AB|nr:tripartite tricarboxylate transporter substrate binding protein [Roseomonas sp. MO-31]
MTITRRAGLVLALATPLVRPARAQALPPTITLVVGAAPGGTTDALAREAAETMRERLGRNVVVENRAGAGGNLAATGVARAAPDGGTLLVAFTSHTLNAALMRQLPYRPVEDFTPIALLARLTTNVLVVGPSVREPDLAAFLAAARARPDRYSFAIGGVGGSLHMQTVLFRSALRLTGPEIPHRGTAPALLDIVGGHVDAMFAPLDVATPLLREGRVRGIAVTGDAPNPSLPDLPVLRSQAPEVGTAVAWFGVLGPAGMAPPVVAALHEAIAAGTRTPRFAERVALGGGETPALTPEGFRDFLVRDTAQWIETARLGGIRPE